MVLASKKHVLFNPGPVNLDDRIKDNLFNMELCHRQPEFDELQTRVRRGLYQAAGFTPESHHLSLLHGSGTLAVDAALVSLVRGRVLVINNGLYCQRLIDTLGPVEGSDVSELALGIGKPIDLGELEREIERLRPEWIGLVHHETTTGLLNPLEAVVALSRKYDCRVFVDAVSAFGAHPVPPLTDVVCFNSNKCLEALPGVAGLFWRSDLDSRASVPVLDVGRYASGMPSTPNVQSYISLEIALDIFAKENRPARYERLARHMWSSGSRFFEPLIAEEHRSHVLCSFKLGGRDPDEIFEKALAHGYVIYPGQKQLRDEIFRVSNMGALIDEELIDDVFEKICS